MNSTINALLPKDYHEHWFSNIMFPLMNPFSVSTVLEQSIKRPQIVIFRCKVKTSAKNSVIHELSFNIVTQNYEFAGNRYLSYSDALSSAELAVSGGQRNIIDTAITAISNTAVLCATGHSSSH